MTQRRLRGLAMTRTVHSIAMEMMMVMPRVSLPLL